MAVYTIQFIPSLKAKRMAVTNAEFVELQQIRKAA